MFPIGRTENLKDQTMTFEQLMVYKTEGCPYGQQCRNCPREVVTKNQYYDKEYQCVFYHHTKDQRRIVLSDSKDFAYHANYCDVNGKESEFSLNYYESMFHPLYYKMFECKRQYCQHSLYCPFYHFEKEKEMWNREFCRGFGKDRVYFVKDKKKYLNNQKNNKKQKEQALQSHQNRFSFNTQNEKANSVAKEDHNSLKIKQMNLENSPKNLVEMAWEGLSTRSNSPNEHFEIDKTKSNKEYKLFEKSEDFSLLMRAIYEEICK